MNSQNGKKRKNGIKKEKRKSGTNGKKNCVQYNMYESKNRLLSTSLQAFTHIQYMQSAY